MIPRSYSHSATTDVLFRLVLCESVAGPGFGQLRRTVARVRANGRLALGHIVTLSGRSYVLARKESGPSLVPLDPQRYAWETTVAILPLEPGPEVSEDADLLDDPPLEQRPFAASSAANAR